MSGAPSPMEADARHAMATRAEEVAALLKVMAHPVRLMLACKLAEGEYSVG